jgi:hypothetical protein
VIWLRRYTTTIISTFFVTSGNVLMVITVKENINKMLKENINKMLIANNFPE